MSDRRRSHLFSKPNELLVDETATRIRMPAPPPMFEEEDAYARLHSIDSGPDEEVSLPSGPLRVFVGPADSAGRVVSREGLPAAEGGRARPVGISLRPSPRAESELSAAPSSRRSDARPMSASVRGGGMDEDLLRTEVPVDLLVPDGLSSPRVAREGPALPSGNRSAPGIQLRLRTPPTAPKPPPVLQENDELLAAGSEEDEATGEATDNSAGFPFLPDSLFEPRADEVHRISSPPPLPVLEAVRAPRPSFFDVAPTAQKPVPAPRRPDRAENGPRPWVIALAAAVVLLGFGGWRWHAAHPETAEGLARWVGRSPPAAAAPVAPLVEAPPDPVTPVAALEPEVVPPPVEPPAVVAPVPFVPPAELPAEAPKPPPAAETTPKPAAPLVASGRRQAFNIPTGRIIVVCERKGTIYVDNVKSGSTLDQRPIELTPGYHTVRVVAGGRSKTQQVRVDSEQLRLIEFRF